MTVKITLKSEDKTTEKHYSVEQGVNRLKEFFPHDLKFEDSDGELVDLTPESLAWELTQQEEPIRILGSWLGVKITVERLKSS